MLACFPAHLLAFFHRVFPLSYLRGGGAGGRGAQVPSIIIFGGGRAPPMLAPFMDGILCRHVDWKRDEVETEDYATGMGIEKSEGQF